MSMPLRREDFAGLIEAPPATDWTAQFAFVNSLSDLKNVADAFEIETKKWLERIPVSFSKGTDLVLQKLGDATPEEIRSKVLPYIDEVILICEEGIESHVTPIHEKETSQDAFKNLRAVSGGAGKFLRKQINRLEDQRVLRHNALVDFYFGLLAFRSEIEEDAVGVGTFSDGHSLADFLRKKVA